MSERSEIRGLIAKLMQAIEASISSSEAVRDAIQELAQRGYEPKMFFVANAEGKEEEGTIRSGELKFELSQLDRDFLRSILISQDLPGQE